MPTSLSLMKHFWSRSSRLFSCADFLLISFILVEHFARNSDVKFNRQFRGYLTMTMVMMFWCDYIGFGLLTARKGDFIEKFERYFGGGNFKLEPLDKLT